MNVQIVRIYLTEDASKTDALNGKTIGKVIKERAVEYFDGYTVYPAKGGWKNDNNEIITENTSIIEVLVPKSSELDGETFGKVNGRYIQRETDEKSVLVTVNNQAYFINGD